MVLLYLGVSLIGFLLGMYLKRLIDSKYTIQSGNIPILEFIIAASFYINVLLLGIGIRSLEFCFFSLFIIIIGYVDLKIKIIPDKFVLYFATINCLFIVLNIVINSHNISHVSSNLFGVIAASGILFFVSLFTNGSIGGGDIKFTAAAGLFLGWRLSIIALFISMIIAGIILFILLIGRRICKKDIIALGPYLSLGMFITMLLA